MPICLRLPKLNYCCFCIDLRPGAIILLIIQLAYQVFFMVLAGSLLATFAFGIGSEEIHKGKLTFHSKD